MSEQVLSTFSIDFLDPFVSSEDLNELREFAHRAFILAAGEYPASTGGEHRFAAVLYPSAADNGDTEISLVQAVLHQYPPSPLAPVVVDFQTRTVVREGQEVNLAIEPEQIGRVQEEIERHMQRIRQGNRASKLGAQREIHVDWTNFLQRLESHGILPAKSSWSYHSTPLKPCPLCGKWTSRCRFCRAIMCLNRECAVSQVMPFRSCSQHVALAACLPCLQTERPISPLAQCPQCELWFCDDDLTWCLGRPKDLSTRSPNTKPHDIPSSDREHPATPICSFCAKDQGRLGRCANIDCWSTSRGIYTRICDSCLPGGLWCACERFWICGACRTSPLDKYFMDCPRCGRAYCPDTCNYIGFCANCSRTTLCDDCFEEDWGCFAEPDVGDKLIFAGRCDETDCRRRICRECLKGARCVGCGMTICISCAQQTNGDRNAGPFCFLCAPEPPSIFPADDSVVLSMEF